MSVKRCNKKYRRELRDARNAAKKMTGYVRAKFLRTSPQKLRLVADLIRGKSAFDAYFILEFTNKRAARVLQKVLRSAVLNAVNNNGLDREKLYVDTVYADEGPAFKRWMPRARGRATVIRKRTSHVTLVVKERESN